MELESKILEAEKIGFQLKAFYHSHPDHEAYFSARIEKAPPLSGNRRYPDARQIVVSVYNRAVAKIKGFAWSDEAKDFVEVPIRQI